MVESGKWINQIGNVFSWGKGDKGVLGIEDQTTLSVPTKIPPKSFFKEKIVQISSGLHHNAILTETGKVFTFGMGSNGRLGNFSDRNQHVPCQVKGLESIKIKSINCGNDATACIDYKNQLWAFGFNNKGKLGVFSIDSKISEPICILQVPNKYHVEGVADISIGFTHSTIRTIDNKIFVLGDIAMNKQKDISGEGKYYPRRLDTVQVRFLFDSD
jgi:alpha-tubulin suppressor-like RCC1 family protein